MSTETEEIIATTKIDYAAGYQECNSCGWCKQKGDPSPCPKGHTTGFQFVEIDTSADPDDEPEDSPEAEAERAESIAKRLAEDNLYSIQDRLAEAVDDHAGKAEMAKTAKKRVESLQEDLNAAVTKLRHAKDATEPDPERYPLYDKAKEAVNGMFAKPDSVPPLAPDNFGEFLRRRQRATPLLSMGFKAGTLKVLEEKYGLKTALELVSKITEYGERNMDFTRAEGITELRMGEIADELQELTEECQAEWKAAHPEQEFPEPEVDDEGDDE